MEISVMNYFAGILCGGLPFKDLAAVEPHTTSGPNIWIGRTQNN